MAVEVETLITRLEARVTQFERELAKASRTADKRTREIARQFDRLNSDLDRKLGDSARRLSSSLALVTRLAGGAGAALGALSIGLGAAALVRLGKDAIDAAGGLGEAAEQIGISTEALQVFQFAAVQSGVSAGELQAAIARLSRTIGDAAAGETEAALAFRRVGVAITDAAGRVRGTDEVLADVSDALARIDDPARRASAAAELFGRQGQKLLPVLSGGRARLDEFAAAARRSGAVLSDPFIALNDEASDELARLGFTAQKTAQSLVSYLSPAIASVAGALADLLGGGGGGEGLLDRARRGVADLEADLIDLGGLPGTERATAARLRELETLRELTREYARASALGRSDTAPPAASSAAASPAALPVPKAALDTLDRQIAKLREQIEVMDRGEEAAARYRREAEARLALEIEEGQVLPPVVRQHLELIAGLEGELKARMDLVDETKAYVSALAEQVDLQLEAEQAQAALQGATIKLSQDMERQVADLEAMTEAATQSVVIWNEVTKRYEVADRQLRIVAATQRLLAQNTALSAEEAERLAAAQVDAEEALRKAQEATSAQADQLNDRMERSKQFARDLGLSFSSAFEDAIVKGNDLRGVLAGLVEDLQRLLVRRTLTEPLLKALDEVLGSAGGGKAPAGKSGGINLGGLFDFGKIFDFGSLILSGLPKFAEGGNPPVGKPFLVGERGPELLTTRVPTTVTPLDRLAAGAGASGPAVVVNMYNNFATGVAGTVRAEIVQVLPRLRSEAVRAVSEAQQRGALRRG